MSPLAHSSTLRLALAAVASTFLLLVIFTYRQQALVSLPSTRPHPLKASSSEALSRQPNISTDSPWQVSQAPRKSEAWLRQCSDLPGDILYDIALDSGLGSHDASPVFAHFQNGSIISTTRGKKFKTEDEFCTVVLVPQLGRNESAPIESPEIPHWGPDGMHASIKSDDVWLIFEHPIYWGSVALHSPEGEADSTRQGDKQNLLSSSTPVVAVYATAYTLNHPGSYQASGAVEWTNYDWAMQDNIELYTVDSKIVLPYNMQNITITSYSSPIIVEGAPVSRPTTLCYHDSHNDLHGRWYLAKSFNGTDTAQTRLNPSAALPYAAHASMIDEWGYTFAPDQCTLPVFSPHDHDTCLANRTLVIHGDSNSRRLLKTLVAAGTKSWCPNPADRICECQDTWEKTLTDSHNNTINNTRYFVESQIDEPMRFGDPDAQTNAYFDMLGGLVRPVFGHSWQHMFSRSQFALDSPTDRRIARHGKVDVVHSSFIGWDVGYASSPEWANPTNGLPALRHALRENYPRGTRLIQRMANAPCCGNYGRRLRYNVPRYALWNAAWRDFWRESEESGEMRVVDVSVLQGRPDAEMRDGGCPMTHLRASHTRLEGMMWMSAVCEHVDGDGSAGGGARMRDGWGLRGSEDSPYKDWPSAQQL